MAMSKKYVLTANGQLPLQSVSCNNTGRYIKLVTIDILKTYANYPVNIVISGRGIPSTTLSFMVASENTTAPTSATLYTSGYADVRAYRVSNSQWQIWANAIEAYGTMQVDRLHGAGTTNGSYRTTINCTNHSAYPTTFLTYVRPIGLNVADSLTSTSVTNALSANKGRELSNKLSVVEDKAKIMEEDISNLTMMINTGVGITNAIVENRLTSTSTTNALSANQGKVLGDKIESLKNKTEYVTSDTLDGILYLEGYNETNLSGDYVYLGRDGINLEEGVATYDFKNSGDSKELANKKYVDDNLALKADSDNVYTKAEIDSKYVDLQNEIIYQDIRQSRLEDYLADKDWAVINADSTSGYIRNYLKVGDQLTYDWTDTTTSSSTTYSVENNVLDFEDETYFKDEQGEYIKPSMVMEWEKTIPFNIEYSPSQAWLTLTNGLPAGTYCIYVSDIKIYDGWQNVRPLYEGKYLTFTLTKPIPSGGQLRGWNIGTTASDLWGVRTYSAWDNHTLIEGVTFTVNTSIVGTYLGKSWGALNTNEIVDNISVGGVTYSIGRINHWERVAYGSNRYKHSVVRRWLNSDALNGEWYVKCEDDPYEVKSTRADLLKRNGFMAGLPTTFKNNLKATKLTIHVASVDVSIADDVANEVDIMYDKVFLLTATQMARASESIGTDVVKEGAPYEYYRLLANSQYNNASMTKYGDNWYFKLWTTYRILKRKAINGGYVNYWQSGCRRSSAYIAWNVNYDGYVSNGCAYLTYVRCLPAFKIGGNRA